MNSDAGKHLGSGGGEVVVSAGGLPAAKARAGSLVAALAAIPEEEVWLAGLQSAHTRRAYRLDVAHFMTTLGIQDRDELRACDRAAILFWREEMVKDGAKPRTIRRRLSAISSLFSHLVAQGLLDTNPTREVKRPRVNRRQGTTASFSQKQARAILDAPDPSTLHGLRDRALLAVGLQVGPRRAEIAHLAVKDFYQNQGFWSLRFRLKGGADNAVSVNPQTAQRIHEYLKAAGHGDDAEGPLFRPIRRTFRRGDDGSTIELESERHLHPDRIDGILRQWVKQALQVTRGFSAHSMRATFITTALGNGASLEDVQRDVGHADPSTTKLYDRRGHNPEKSASFFANY